MSVIKLFILSVLGYLLFGAVFFASGQGLYDIGLNSPIVSVALLVYVILYILKITDILRNRKRFYFFGTWGKHTDSLCTATHVVFWTAEVVMVICSSLKAGLLFFVWAVSLQIVAAFTFAFFLKDE